MKSLLSIAYHWYRSLSVVLNPILVVLFILDITHFGKKYTNNDPQKEMDPWNSLDIPVINEIYRQYWLDFVLLGYPIPDKINTDTNITTV